MKKEQATTNTLTITYGQGPSKTITLKYDKPRLSARQLDGIVREIKLCCGSNDRLLSDTMPMLELYNNAECDLDDLEIDKADTDTNLLINAILKQAPAYGCVTRIAFTSCIIDKDYSYDGRVYSYDKDTFVYLLDSIYKLNNVDITFRQYLLNYLTLLNFMWISYDHIPENLKDLITHFLYLRDGKKQKEIAATIYTENPLFFVADLIRVDRAGMGDYSAYNEAVGIGMGNYKEPFPEDEVINFLKWLELFNCSTMEQETITQMLIVRREMLKGIEFKAPEQPDDVKAPHLDTYNHVELTDKQIEHICRAINEFKFKDQTVPITTKYNLFVELYKYKHERLPLNKLPKVLFDIVCSVLKDGFV